MSLTLECCWLQGLYDGDCSDNPDDIDHAVVIVGFASEGDEDYWIVKNSWGLSWGIDGYIYMKRNTGLPYGLCAINAMASYPTKVGSVSPSPYPSPSSPPPPSPLPPPPPSPVQCSDGSYCDSGETCCCISEGGSVCAAYGCCPYENGVCCEDSMYCCPEGYPICDVEEGLCFQVKGLYLNAKAFWCSLAQLVNHGEKMFHFLSQGWSMKTHMEHLGV